MAGVTTEGCFASMSWYFCHIFVCLVKNNFSFSTPMYHVTIVVLSTLVSMNRYKPPCTSALNTVRGLQHHPFYPVRYLTMQNPKLPASMNNPHHAQQISRINPVCSYSTSHPLFSLIISTSHAIFYHNKCYFIAWLCYKVIVTYGPVAC